MRAPIRIARLGIVTVYGLAALSLGQLQRPSAAADEQERLHVGLQPDGRIVVPTNQVLHPAGKQLTFPGRPVDLTLADGGHTLVVKNLRDLLFIDVATAKIKQTLTLHDKNDKDLGFSVVGLVVHDGRVYVSDAKNHVRVASRRANGTYQWDRPLALSDSVRPRDRLRREMRGDAHAAGLAVGPGGSLWLTATRANAILRINPSTGLTEETVAVGVAPYMICFATPNRCFVSNWGGDPPKPGDSQGDSSGSPVRTDPRTGVANQGSVSVVDLVDGRWRQVRTIGVDMHPSGMILSSPARFLYVANANSDSVSVIDVRKAEVVETILCRPQAGLPFGSGCNALALSADGGTLYVANGTNNCIAVISLGARARPRQTFIPPLVPKLEFGNEAGGNVDKSTLAGLIPTGWYPSAIRVSGDGKTLFVANVKGHGSLSQPRPVRKGKNSHDHLGSVSIIPVPDSDQLARYTAEVNRNNRLAYSLAGLEKARPDAQSVPVPRRHGEPSLFKHVVYIIKENRTYDQVFGDLKEGNGDPNLVLFGERVTPNHHALARQFTLLDNFYCSGILSADGHSWTDAAYVTDYLEKAFGGFTRSYPDDGHDPLAFSLTGFLWDNALAHHKTFRNYGEFVREEDYAPKGTTWTDLYNDYKQGTHKIPLTPQPTLPTLKPYTHPTYPYFPLITPDVYRAKLFLDDLKQFEEKGEMPNLVYASLPCDHTEGTRPGFPTPRAMVADNDLALGRIVEALSKSKFWKDTCMFVVEDDPQNGFDHVDGHRTVALVISPYTRRHFVDSTNYNQTSMVKTIELVLGLPPMNQLDLSATAMRNCFQAKPDLSPYACVPNQIALDEMNPPVRELTGKALYWARQSLALDLDHADAADEDKLNRILWHSVRGYDTRYPEEYVNRDGDDSSD